MFFECEKEEKKLGVGVGGSLNVCSLYCKPPSIKIKIFGNQLEPTV
jgi:hypothetical protein